MPDEKITEEYLLSTNSSIGVEFCDYYLTNIQEQASCPDEGEIYQPYQVRMGIDGCGHQIDPSNFVTEQCLIRKIVWSYTLYNPKTSKPRIGYLRLETMTGDVIEIIRKGVAENIVTSDVRHTLEGAYIITTIQMSNDIIRLRVCGSKRPEDFLDAFDYYSLWEVTPLAKKLLEKEAKRPRQKQAPPAYADTIGDTPLAEKLLEKEAKPPAYADTIGDGSVRDRYYVEMPKE